jgi:hypothetical protein
MVLDMRFRSSFPHAAGIREIPIELFPASLDFMGNVGPFLLF